MIRSTLITFIFIDLDQRWDNLNNQAFNNGNNGRHMDPVANRLNQSQQSMLGTSQSSYHNMPQSDVNSAAAQFTGEQNDCEIIVVSRNLT